MKATSIILSILAAAALASAQTNSIGPRRWPLPRELANKNKVTTAEAVKAASKLQVGTWEQDVASALSHDGLIYHGWMQRSNECQWPYLLTDGTLVLFFAPQVMTKDGRWSGVGMLQAASVFYTDGWHGTNIALLKRP